MIICICRNLNRSSVAAAINDGACQPEDVHAAHGCAPQCGCCLEMIEDMIVQARTAPAAE